MLIWLSRIRIGAALILVAVGVAWEVGGTGVLTAYVRLLPTVLALLMIAAGVWTLARLAVPSGALAGPALLIAVGVVIFAVQFDHLRWSSLVRVAPLALVAGGVVVAMTPRVASGEIMPPVRVYNGFLWYRRAEVTGDAPRKLVLRAILGTVAVDLRAATYVPERRLSVDIAILAGRIVVNLPKDWLVVTGRVEQVYGVRLVGETDSITTSGQPSGGGPGTSPASTQVVLNIWGWGGAVRIEKV